MSNTIQFLNDQIDSDEFWKRDYKRAAECNKIEETIKHGLALFKIFRSVDELWSRRVQTGIDQFDPEMVNALHRVYSWWLQPCDGILSEIEKLRKDGYNVSGASELSDACATVRGILKTNVSELIESFKTARAA